MTTTFHLCLDISGALKDAKLRRQLSGGFRAESGCPMTEEEFHDFLIEQLRRGRAVLPLAKCDNFSYENGCQGHPEESIAVSSAPAPMSNAMIETVRVDAEESLDDENYNWTSATVLELIATIAERDAKLHTAVGALREIEQSAKCNCRSSGLKKLHLSGCNWAIEERARTALAELTAKRLANADQCDIQPCPCDLPRCARCNYTRHDDAFNMDHGICEAKGGAIPPDHTSSSSTFS